jgi:hypothetical protein
MIDQRAIGLIVRANLVMILSCLCGDSTLEFRAGAHVNCGDVQDAAKL